MTLQPLRHPDFERTEDAALARTFDTWVSRTAHVQFMAELVGRLRGFLWWNPAELRATWPAAERMKWLKERPDVRQRITSALTGLAPRAARNKAPEFQATLLDSVIEDGDINVQTFEHAFQPVELVAYGPVGAFWKLFRDKMPWRDESPAHRQLVEWILEELLASKSRVREEWKRKPILSANALRSALPGRVWHVHVPIDVRIAIDEARLERERTRPTEPFTSLDELMFATPQVLASQVPLREFARLFDLVERELGFATATPSSTSIPAQGGNVSTAANVSTTLQPGLPPQSQSAFPVAAVAALRNSASIPVSPQAQSEAHQKALRPESASLRAAEPPSQKGTLPPAPEGPSSTVTIDEDDFAFDDV